jgi:hypothetical protein
VVYVYFTTKNTLTVTQGQALFPALCRRGKTSAITRNGQVVAFIVPRKRMAGLLEQMEILANPEGRVRDPTSQGRKNGGSSAGRAG